MTFTASNCGGSINKKEDKNDMNEKRIVGSIEKYYKDFDLYTLKGKNEIIDNDRSYPYVKVETTDDSLAYTAYFSNTQKYKSPIYFRKGDFFQYFTQYPDDFCNIYEYCMLYDEKIITYSYCGDPFIDNEAFLHSVTIKTRDSYDEYYYADYFLLNPKNRKTLILPSIQFIEPNKKYLISKTSKKYVQHGDILRVINEEIFFDGNKVNNKFFCFMIKDYSFFWWSLYGNHMKIDCPE